MRQDLSDERLINKILYPKKILCLIAFYEILMLSIFFLLIHLAHNMEGIIAAIGMPGIYTLIIFVEFSQRYKTQKIVISNEKIIVEGKIQKESLGKLINERNEIKKSDVCRVGYSRDLYGKEIYYYHYQRRGPNEIAIELKDGSRILFDAYEYTSKQKLYFLKAITEKEDVLVEGKLKTMMSWKRYKNL